MGLPALSSAVRQGLLGWVVPHLCKAAGKDGGQLVTTPRGSPSRGLICWPSGFGWLGSGCWTEKEEGSVGYLCESVGQWVLFLVEELCPEVCVYFTNILRASDEKERGPKRQWQGSEGWGKAGWSKVTHFLFLLVLVVCDVHSWETNCFLKDRRLFSLFIEASYKQSDLTAFLPSLFSLDMLWTLTSSVKQLFSLVREIQSAPPPHSVSFLLTLSGPQQPPCQNHGGFTIPCWCVCVPATFSFPHCLFRVAESHPNPPWGTGTQYKKKKN